MLTVSGALEEIIPALSAAGLSVAEIRAISEETQRRMGRGGTAREWLTTMGAVVAETRNDLAMRAYMLAIDEWSGGSEGQT